MPAVETIAAEDPQTASAQGISAVPAELVSPLSPEEVVNHLSAVAKKGRLPEFEVVRRASASEPPIIKMAIFGAPYDRELIVTVQPNSNHGSRLIMQSRLKQKLPVIMIIIFVLTIWPGVWLTHSMLVTYFSWYRINTWWWYVPFMLLGIPVLWKQFKKSEASAEVERAQLIEKLRAETQAS